MNFATVIECNDKVADPFEVGRAIGKLIAMNAWMILSEDHGVTLDPHVIELGFTTPEEALEAAQALDDLQIVGVDTHVKKR
jgi:hypothetical protein